MSFLVVKIWARKKRRGTVFCFFFLGEKDGSEGKEEREGV